MLRCLMAALMAFVLALAPIDCRPARADGALQAGAEICSLHAQHDKSGKTQDKQQCLICAFCAAATAVMMPETAPTLAMPARIEPVAYAAAQDILNARPAHSAPHARGPPSQA
jgi:hypothetical protein